MKINKHDLMDTLQRVEGAMTAEQKRRAELFPELVAALESMLVSHSNLYKMAFGENSDPANDLVRRHTTEVLAKAKEA